VHLEPAPPDPQNNIGLRIRARTGGRVLAYLSAAGGLTDEVRRAVDGVDALFFDGTFWSSDELPALGLGTKRAEDMAHLPVGGAGGSLARLAGLRAGRRVYIHVNNTNPMLRDDSPERAQVTGAGWEVAWDGMEVRL
jgi:pyrroloquinoline quinone biosynthesis protein B